MYNKDTDYCLKMLDARMYWSSLVRKRLLVMISPGTNIGDLLAYSTYTWQYSPDSSSRI